ncbi:macro domain-containing protein [uncultured Rikenella sp.]|uniref:type II toxin-antitoxin system antitoxin DNA ADP-ribosyl glycohydrolase DarG n=1 Tax=uncultured Rikenella sp. TaxID=368003 RepID=UPI002606FFCF|nr:macro domain-containing protein [uncultured Rikenella sp.]
MISYTKGNMLESPTQALVNTVNTVGIMGKGIALQFKMMFPNNFRAYQQACKEGRVRVGHMFVTHERMLSGEEKIIINFPTKEHWRSPSQYSFVTEGLDDLRRVIQDENIQSITLPPLGCGNGGLKWDTVRQMIEDKLSDLDCDIHIYTPNHQVAEILKKENCKLTPARAMLLDVFYDLVQNDEYVSLFAGEKICYFLQRFGAEKIFNLTYKPYFYGPYSGKVKFVIHALNGQYIHGYESREKHAFDPLMIDMSMRDELQAYINKKLTTEQKNILIRTKKFLSGFYSTFSMELLSSVDFIIQQHDCRSKEEILGDITHWNERKSKLFNQIRYVEIALARLQEFGLIPVATQRGLF